MKNVLWIVVVVVLFVAGCANTAGGFGSFVKGIGQDIEDAASKQLE